MSDTKTCERCGATLPPGHADGAPCPRCLLDLGRASRPAPAKPGRAPSLDELAPLFPNLELEELIGQGGMGAVYRARHKELGRKVALKILTAPDDDPTFDERFAREARAMAGLSHANIVSVHDFGKAGPFTYLMLEYVDGVNVRELIRARSVAPREALGMVTQICAALQYAHDKGVVHRDIKPENILVDTSGEVKLVDFGLAKVVGHDEDAMGLTGTHQAMGTFHYMAPEQYERPLEVDHRADIYSLGVVFYELLTGELPVGRFSAPSEVVQVDVRLDEVVLRTLEKQPEKRYQRAALVGSDVETISKTKLETAAAAGAGAATAGTIASSRERKKTPMKLSMKVLVILLACTFGMGTFGTCAAIPMVLLLGVPAATRFEPEPFDQPVIGEMWGTPVRVPNEAVEEAIREAIEETVEEPLLRPDEF